MGSDAEGSITRGGWGDSRFVIAWTVLLAMAVTHSGYFHFGTYTSVQQALATAMVGVVVAFLVLIDPVRWMIARIRQQTARYALTVIALSMLAGIAATWLIPVPPAPGRNASLEIVALGTKAPEAVSSEVWARLEVDGRNIDAEEFSADRGWQPSGAFMLSSPGKQPATLRWTGDVADYARLVFVSHPWSGKVRMVWNGRERFIDLYGKDSGGGVGINLLGGEPTNDYLKYPDRTPLQRWVQLVDGLLIGIALWFAFVFLATRGRLHREAWRPGMRMLPEILLHAAPTIVIGFFLTALYFPALMTPDSLDQWRQSGSGSFNDAHPLIYTFLIAALRKVWDTPAIVALVQCIAMALACGWLITVVRRSLKTGVGVAHVAAWLVALHPLVALINVTIWKDVPYTAATVALTAYVLGALFLGQPDLRRPRNIALFCAIAVVCMTARHNGPPVGFAALVLMWFIQPHARKQWLATVVLTLGLFGFIRGPLVGLVDAVPANSSYVLYSHHVAAHLARGDYPVDADDRRLIQQIDSTDAAWRYDCSTVNPTLFNQNFNSSLASKQRNRLLKMWLQMVIERPGIDVDHVVCSTGLIWRVLDLERDPLYLSKHGLWAPEARVRWIVGEPGDPVEASFFPGLAQSFGQRIVHIDNDLLWRPALFMYGLIFAALVAWQRQKDPRILVILILPAVHTLILGIAAVAQDARYQLPIYVLALTTCAMLLAAPRRSAGHERHERTERRKEVREERVSR